MTPFYISSLNWLKAIACIIEQYTHTHTLLAIKHHCFYLLISDDNFNYFD